MGWEWTVPSHVACPGLSQGPLWSLAARDRLLGAARCLWDPERSTCTSCLVTRLPLAPGLTLPQLSPTRPSWLCPSRLLRGATLNSPDQMTPTQPGFILCASTMSDYLRKGQCVQPSWRSLEDKGLMDVMRCPAPECSWEGRELRADRSTGPPWSLSGFSAKGSGRQAWESRDLEGDRPGSRVSGISGDRPYPEHCPDVSTSASAPPESHGDPIWL